MAFRSDFSTKWTRQTRFAGAFALKGSPKLSKCGLVNMQVSGAAGRLITRSVSQPTLRLLAEKICKTFDIAFTPSISILQ